MNAKEYKDLAVANGYVLGNKTDEELLADYKFHKAACTGMGLEAIATGKDGLGHGVAVPSEAYRLRLMIALDGFDAGRATDEIWPEVLLGGKKWADIHDAEGNLKLEML